MKRSHHMKHWRIISKKPFSLHAAVTWPPQCLMLIVLLWLRKVSQSSSWCPQRTWTPWLKKGLYTTVEDLLPLLSWWGADWPEKSLRLGHQDLPWHPHGASVSPQGAALSLYLMWQFSSYFFSRLSISFSAFSHGFLYLSWMSPLHEFLFWYLS